MPIFQMKSQSASCTLEGAESDYRAAADKAPEDAIRIAADRAAFGVMRFSRSFRIEWIRSSRAWTGSSACAT